MARQRSENKLLLVRALDGAICAYGERLPFQHSPSSAAESEFGGKMFDFRRWQSFRKGIGDHIISRAVNQTDFALFDNPAYEMKSYINMLCTSMVLVIFCQRNCRLIVRKERCHVIERFKE